MTVFHLNAKVYNTFVIHNTNCNIFTWLNYLPFNSHQFNGRWISCSTANPGAFLRLWAISPLTQTMLNFFCLTLLCLLAIQWQMQEKASMSCSIFHAKCWFLKPYLQLCSGLSYIFYLHKLSCKPELLPKHCSGVEGVGLHALCLKWAVSYRFVKTKLFTK